MTSVRGGLERLWAHRRRVAPLVLVIGVIVVGTQLSGAIARETRLRFDLGPEHERVKSLRLTYTHDGDEIQGSASTWPFGTPRAFERKVTLVPGEYEVRAEVGGPEPRTVVRRFDVPADGVIRIDLSQDGDHRP